MPDMTLATAWPQTIFDWAKLVALVLGGGWALWTYDRNRRIKAAEILVELEKEYQERVIRTLLAIEYSETYEKYFRNALIKVRDAPESIFTTLESENVDHLERVLRHFFLCARLRGLGVDNGALNISYKYYLGVMTSKERCELVWYMKTYWRRVFEWAQECMAPPWKRPLLRLTRIPSRLKYWFIVEPIHRR